MTPALIIGVAAIGGIILLAMGGKGSAKRYNFSGRQYRVYKSEQKLVIVREYGGEDALTATLDKTPSHQGFMIALGPKAQKDPDLAARLNAETAMDILNHGEEMGFPHIPNAEAIRSKAEAELERLGVNISGQYVPPAQFAI